MSDRVQKTPKTATDIFVPRTKQGQSRQALTYKKHGGFLQVKMLIQTFHALGSQPGMNVQ
ncbi:MULTISPECIES: hypothetical protein [Pseudomonas fluorescens group]|uniref:hypothetical protein n=1 Tax=Pseudomonas fluorescens group TaxID=136843 RepID=UPI00177C2F7F|nr:hypothetical protein [Pseudomonas fluorescens]MBD8235414.1 hypothetical protein [Pseudomonas fluorescens]MDY0894152.1 hypothetical protein [Pseudomonas fluorescens]